MSRISFVLPSMSGGGAERVTASLVNGAARRGHSVDLLLMRREGPNLARVDPAVRIVDLGAQRIRNVVGPLFRYLRRERPEALQVSMWPLTIAAIVAAKLARSGTKVITTDHITLSQEYGGSPPRIALLKASTRLFYPWADLRIAVSRGSATDLSRLSRSRVDTIYNPIPPITDGSVAKGEWPEGKRKILAAGRLIEQKNHLLLLNAVRQIDPELEVCLVIMGEGEMRPALQDRIVELGLERRVRLPGYVDDPAPYYRSADVFVLSSDYEGFGNVIVEAMSAGLPVVSTDCPDGPREILANGKFGTLVPCGDSKALAGAIEAALGEPTNSDRLRSRAAEFGEEVAVERYLEAMLGPAQRSHAGRESDNPRRTVYPSRDRSAGSG